MKGEQMKALEIMKRFVKDERGLETVEYAVMTALIVGAVVVAIGLLASAVVTRFGIVEEVVNPAAVPG